MGGAKASPSPARAAAQAAKGPAGDVVASTRRRSGGGQAWRDFCRAVLLAEEVGAASVRKQGNTITMVFPAARPAPTSGAASPPAAEKQPNAAARRAARRREAARIRESGGFTAEQAVQAPTVAEQAHQADPAHGSNDMRSMDVEGAAARAVAEPVRAASGTTRDVVTGQRASSGSAPRRTSQ